MPKVIMYVTGGNAKNMAPSANLQIVEIKPGQPIPKPTPVITPPEK